MTDDIEKLQDMTKYNRGCLVVTTNNSRLTIANIGSIVITSRHGPHKVAFQDAYYVPCMKKNLHLVWQLTLSRNYVLFDP